MPFSRTICFQKTLKDIAPRIYVAYRARLQQEADERDYRRWLRSRLIDEERNLAHRDLQMCRLRSQRR